MSRVGFPLGDIILFHTPNCPFWLKTSINVFGYFGDIILFNIVSVVANFPILLSPPASNWTALDNNSISIGVNCIFHLLIVLTDILLFDIVFALTL